MIRVDKIIALRQVLLNKYGSSFSQPTPTNEEEGNDKFTGELHRVVETLLQKNDLNINN